MTRETNRSPDAGRLVGIDLLRAWSILAVLASHWLLVGAYSHSPWEEPLIRFALRGVYGVAVFFVISGFVITRSIMAHDGELYRMNVRAFYARRIARIQPLFLSTLAIGAAMMALGARGHIYGEMAEIFQVQFWLSILTFWFDFLKVTGQHYGVQWLLLWSLAVEERFYLLLPMAIYLCRTRTRLTVLLAAIAVAYPFCAPTADDVTSTAGIAAWALASFGLLALGVLTALYADAIPLRTRGSALLVATLSVSIAAVAFGLKPASWNAATLGLAAAAFILASQSGMIFTNSVWRFPARMGQLSYGLYLLHPLVLYFVVAPLRDGVGFNIGFVVFVALCFVTAELSWTFLERPCDRLVRRVLARRLEAPEYLRA
jgi:peptidoglycan/LPS O-acetylase OafA/YrhL